MPLLTPATLDPGGAQFGAAPQDPDQSWAWWLKSLQPGQIPIDAHPQVSSSGPGGVGASAQPVAPPSDARIGAGAGRAFRMPPPGTNPISSSTYPGTGGIPPAPTQIPPAPRVTPTPPPPEAMPPQTGTGIPSPPPSISDRVASLSQKQPSWAQRIGLALLSATRLAPLANQIVRPKWSSEMAGLQSQLGAQEKEAQIAELQGRGDWYKAQAQEGKGRYLRVGTGIFDQATGQWVTMPADKSNLVPVDPAVAKARGLAPLDDGRFWVPASVASQFVKPGKEPGGMYIDKATGDRLGIVPDDDGRYYLPPQGIGPHVTATEKPESSVTASQLDARAQQLLAKMGQALPSGIPPEAMADIRKLAPLIQNSGALTPAEKSELQSHLTMKTSAASSGTQATIRLQGFLQGKEYPMLDTANQNSPVMLTPADINAANQREPGRYVPTGPSIPALRQTSLLEDIRGNVQQTRDSLNAMPDFDVMDKAKIALALRSRDPRSAISSLIASGAMGTLTPPQQDYLINVTNLIENAMAMRTVLGAGQGSEDLRNAIQAVIPGPTTPSREYAQKQLNTFEKTLNRLERGVPTVPLRTNTGAEGGRAPGSYRQTATGPGGHKIGSNDNGQTWYDVQTGQKVQ